MTQATTALPPHAHDLTLTRLIPATPDKLFRAWTEPELIKQWFVPKPWTIARAENDLRPGGQCLIVMRSPEGQEMPNPGVYLEVMPNRRLVFTDAFTAGWVPSEKPFMTGIISFNPEAGGTRYTAVVRHWTAEAKAQHEQMGFHQGWGVCTDQLAELVSRL